MATMKASNNDMMKADVLLEHVGIAGDKADYLLTMAKVVRGVLQAQGYVNLVDANVMRKDISLAITHAEAALRILNELPIKGDDAVH